MKMTTDLDQNADRLARLNARRSAPSDQKRAVIGKILAAGLTSTTVFGITAALGWSATSAADNGQPAQAGNVQLVLDLATGQLIKYVDGVAVSAQQVVAPGQLPSTMNAQTATAPAMLSAPTPTLPANWTPPPTSDDKIPQNSTVAAAPQVTIDPQTEPTTAVVESPILSTPEIVTIPIALPQPTRDRSSSGGGGGGSSSGS
jgi:hypothetical protein